MLNVEVELFINGSLRQYYNSNNSKEPPQTMLMFRTFARATAGVRAVHSVQDPRSRPLLPQPLAYVAILL